MKISKATVNDSQILADLLTQAIKIKLTYSDESWGETPFTAEETAALITHSETYLFYIDEKLVGTVSITWSDDTTWGMQEIKAGYIHRLASSREHKGVGAKILNWSEQMILSRGIRTARLDCHDSNTKLCEYYLNKGYKKVSVIGEEPKIALFEKSLANL